MQWNVTNSCSYDLYFFIFNGIIYLSSISEGPLSMPMMSRSCATASRKASSQYCMWFHRLDRSLAAKPVFLCYYVTITLYQGGTSCQCIGPPSKYFAICDCTIPKANIKNIMMLALLLSMAATFYPNPTILFKNNP